MKNRSILLKLLKFFLSLRTAIWLLMALLCLLFYGSVVMPWNPEFQSLNTVALFQWLAGNALGITWWHWAAIGFISLLTANTLLCSIESVVKKKSARQWMPEEELRAQAERGHSRHPTGAPVRQGRDLYLYLNHIYLGASAYGVAAAAQEYFDKRVDELSVAQAALLAGLPQAPSRYSPVRHLNRAKYRQRYVLERMAQERYVTWEASETALKEEIQLTHRDVGEPTYVAAPYFVEYVRRLLEDRYGGTAPYQAGLNVYTTVDLPTQHAAEQALRSNLDAIDMGRTRARHKSTTS